MRKMTKLLSLLLALCMVFSLAACGGGSSAEQKEDTAPETQPETEPEAEEPEAEEPEAEPEAEAEPEISEAAQNYPDGPITWYMQGPGSAADTIGRILGDALAKELNCTCLYENLPGAGGMNELNPVFDAEPDATKIAILAVPYLTITPLTNSSCRYTMDDFEMIHCIFEQPQCLVVPADAPYDTFEEWYAYVEENPGTFRFAVPGLSSVHTFALEHLKLETGLDYSCVVYDGAAEMNAALLGGHVEGLVLGFSEFSAHFYTGEFKIICYTTNFKNPDYPDYPTLEELGYEARGIPFQGLCIKAGADPDVVAKLNAAIDKILADESVIEQLKAADSWVDGTCYGGEEFAQTVKNAYDYYDELLVSTGLIDELSS